MPIEPSPSPSVGASVSPPSYSPVASPSPSPVPSEPSPSPSIGPSVSPPSYPPVASPSPSLPPPTPTILELLAARPDTGVVHSLLSSVPALKALASNRDAVLTFFPPSDAAFARVASDLGLDLSSSSDPSALMELLAYHFVPDALLTTEALPEGTSQYNTSLVGSSITTDRLLTHVRVIGAASAADVVVPNLRAGQAVVHVIDYVLLPAAPSVPSLPPFLPSPFPSSWPSPIVPSYPIIPTPTPTVPPPAPTILELLAARPDTGVVHSLLSSVPALKALASNPDAVLTFFPPSDAAFARVASDLGLDLSSSSDPSALMELLAYHFVPDALLTTEALPEGTSQYNTSLVGSSITIDRLLTHVRVIGAASAADVVVPNLRAGQAVVHVIDYVLLPAAPSGPSLPPPTPTILELLAARPDTGVVHSLLSSVPALKALASNRDAVLTFFPPSDAAFARVASDLGLDLSSSSDPSALMELLAYHFVPDALLTTEALPEGTSQYNTSLVGSSITIDRLLTHVRVIGAASAADVVVPNLRAGQAVVHVIDYVLLPAAPSGPSLPPPTPTILELLAARPDTGVVHSLLSSVPALKALASNRDAVLTFFPPSDAAFARVASDLGLDLSSSSDPSALMELLAYHFVPDALLTTEALPEGTSQYNTSLVGSSITIDRLLTHVRVIGAASAADVVVPNLRAGQAVVHVIDYVLLPAAPSGPSLPPPTPTILELLAARPDTGVVHSLLSSVPALKALASNRDAVLTFFPPSDAAFARVASDLGLDLSSSSDPSALMELLAYHFVPDALLTTEALPEGTSQYNTSLVGSSITIDRLLTHVRVIGAASAADVLVPNLRAGQAVVHVIDYVLLPAAPSGPSLPPPTPTILELLAARPDTGVVHSLLSSVPALKALASNRDAVLTFFPPSDAAFARVASDLGLDLSSSSDPSALMELLAYHFVPDALLTTEALPEGTSQYNTSLVGSSITIDRLLTHVRVIGAASAADVLVPNLRAGQAVVHVIDYVLLPAAPSGPSLPPPTPTILELLAARPDTGVVHSLLSSVPALKALASNRDAVLTFFPPSDAAFARVASDLGLDLSSSSDPSALMELLAYHFVPDALLTTEALPEGTSQYNTSLVGSSITIDRLLTHVRVIGAASAADVVVPNLRAGQAVVHVIDYVLLPAAPSGPSLPPPTPTILELLAARPDTGVVHSLLSSVPALKALASNRDAVLTFFPPSDAAFARVASDLGLDLSSSSDPSALMELLAYHFVPDALLTTEALPEGTSQYNTSLVGSSITIDRLLTHVRVIGAASAADVVVPNLRAGQAVVHVIDYVLLPAAPSGPSLPPPTPTILELLAARPDTGVVHSLLSSVPALKALASNRDAVLTFFPPSDAAFARVASDLGLDLSSSSDPSALMELLAYHFVPDALLTTEALPEGTSQYNTSLVGSSITIDRLLTHVRVIGAASAADVVVPNLRAGQAVVHVIDYVLLPAAPSGPSLPPPTPTILELLAARPDTGVVHSLLSSVPALKALASNRDAVLTFFPPSDAAFARVASDLGLDLSSSSDPSALMELLAYHFVPDALLTTEALPEGTSQYNTSLVGSSITIDRLLTHVRVIGAASAADVVVPNLRAGQAVVHVIDYVLLPAAPSGPSLPPPTPTILELLAARPDTGVVHSLLSSVPALKALASNRDAVLTFFPPSDAAFARVASDLGLDLSSSSDPSALMELLAYHFVPDALLTTEALPEGTSQYNTSLVGSSITIDRLLTHVRVIGAASAADVVVPNLRAGQAVVHVIDYVLLPAAPSGPSLPPPTPTILELLAARPDTGVVHSLLSSVPALKALASNRDAVLTFFPPSNAAFARVASDLGLDLSSSSDPSALMELLAYHFVPDALLTTEALPEGTSQYNTSLVGSSITIDRLLTHVRVIGAASAADVVVPNLRAGQAVVHVIDYVLLPAAPSGPSLPPPTPTILELLAARPDTGVVHSLLSSVPALKALASNRDAVLTFFPPSNAAFARVASDLGLDLSSSSDPSALMELLAYHFVPDALLTTEALPEGTSQYNTSLVGSSITIDRLLTHVRVIGAASAADVVVPNLRAGQAVVHVIDYVLLPAAPSGPSLPLPTPTILELLAARPDTGVVHSLLSSVPALKALASNRDAVLTFFPPSDAAFARVASDLGLDLSSSSDPSALMELLAYHFVPDALLTTEALPEGTSQYNTSLVGSSITIDRLLTHVRVIGAASAADVVVLNLRAGQAVVHVIDYPSTVVPEAFYAAAVVCSFTFIFAFTFTVPK
ncbi:hypothetical protein HYH03_013122 [Edaphochlamys debaryana]|uniref:FAS1 domain-containing protein n=1 Tax=Edaphochlamys debaryana TaxID=47281 RepID=A0A835XU25_9CHLO|nr:hypothetical protein HYH03_013122 [Edaphochlamys debaryana]|eukprot:KAG2488271.1 hypothetical protein HYH03_013122 [Edaphochlamys debaryana]